MTACNDHAGVSSITTVTCCPYRGDITLGCVTPSTLSNVWETLFCTWIAPESGTTVSITLSDDDDDGGTTLTAAVSMESPGGINALGIRMVYQSSDLAAATASGTGAATTSGGTATATSTGASSTSTGAAGDLDGNSSSSSGLSTGVIIAIAVIIPVVLIAVATGLFFFIRKRKHAQKADLPGEGAAGVPYDYGKNGYSAVAPGAGGYYDPKSPAPPSEVSGVGAYGVKNQQQELAELGQQEPPVELPAEQYR